MTPQKPIVLKPPTSEIPKDRIGEMSMDAPSKDEVRGREMQLTYLQCSSCGAVRPVMIEPGKYSGYRCPDCGTVGIC